MNDKIFLSISFLILFLPFIVGQFIGIIYAIEKTTIKSPVSYINTSIVKIIVKSFGSKSKLDYKTYFLYGLILFLSLFVNSISWLSILSKSYILSIDTFLISIIGMAIIIALILQNSSKRLNITDFFIEYNSFIVILLLSSIICFQNNNANKVLEAVSLFVILTTTFFYSLRIEKILAIKSYFIKYLFDIYRFSLISLVVSYELSSKSKLAIDYKAISIVILSIVLTVVYKFMYDRIINTKNNNINKYLERIIVIVLNIILLVSLII